MAQPENTKRPKIFISHAWENKPLVERLESELKSAGAEVWVDHIGIRGGDNLPEQISNALEWCNTLLLIWSKAARNSEWVKLEWTNAISLKKLIIPCLLENVPLPAIMASRAYVDFRNVDRGLAQLLQALRLVQQTEVPISDEPVQRAVNVGSYIPSKLKPPQILLRSLPIDYLSCEAVKAMLKQYGFHCRKYDWCKDWSNPQGQGIEHKFELQQSERIVVDYATGLIWEKSGSLDSMLYFQTKDHIQRLNNGSFACFHDWRLPTLEEAMSLIERKKMNGDLYIAPVFDQTQKGIWTADKSSVGHVWYVNFDYGICNHVKTDHGVYVRAVRSGQWTI